MLRTPLCHTLGIEVPIFSAGISAAAGPELAAAVSNAGGCGVLGASRFPDPYLREKVRRVRALTQRPFGVNIIIDKPAMETVVACLEEHVPRAVKETLYQSERPWVVDHSKFARAFGSRPTPHEQAIAETLGWLQGKPTVTVAQS